MLSVENPPDRPCSSKIPALNSDEKGHPPERPSSSLEADPADGPDEAQHPHFSLRDYVFASRSKDIGTNWPFPQQHLQLCMKHGVRDLLPPFEPPDLLRARFREKCVEAEHLILCSEVKGTQTEVSDTVKHSFSLPNQESVLGSSHQPQNPLSEDKSTVVQAVIVSEDNSFYGEAESKITGHEHTERVPSLVIQLPGLVQQTRSTVSEASSEVEVAKAPQSAENFTGLSERSIKKCRLIVKFGGAPELNRTEGTVSNFSSVSDTMASKVCPVCKTFSSTSNTTLNAHIDQCLSVESGAKWDTIMLSQHKVKPRKKRSMEDICATAPRCTLEDLDRRNGTNWALDLASIIQNNEPSCRTERKQPRISPLKATDDEREGAVYVDSNGTKLLILSKFNDAQSAATVDSSVPKICKREFKNKSSPFGKRKCLPQKYRKYLKAKVQKKKISTFSHLKGEIHKEHKLHEDMHHEGERISQASNTTEQIKVSKPGTLGHWICSKRSSLLKHVSSKSGHTKPRNPLAITHHTSMESDQSTACDYFAIGGHIQKFCNSSNEIMSPPKARSTDVLSDAVLASYDQRKHSTDLPENDARSIGNNPSTSKSIMLKLSRSTGNCIPSVKGRRVEIQSNAVRKSGKFRSLRKTSMDCHPQMHKGEKGSRRSRLMDGQQCTKESIKCNGVVQHVVSKKLRKHPRKSVAKLPLELAKGSPSAHSPGSTSNNVTSGIDQSNFSETVVRPETSSTLGHLSPHHHNTMDFNQAGINYHASEGGEHHTRNHSQPEAECHHAEVTEFDAYEVPVNMGSMVKYPFRKSIGTCGSKDVISEDHVATTFVKLGSHLSLEYERELSSSDEVIIEASLPKSLGNHGMHGGDIASDFVCQDICQVSQTEPSVKDRYCSELQNMEYEADVASIQGSNACLTRPEDRVLDLGKTSSVTPGTIVTMEIHNIMVDGEASGSPVSTSSTISHLSVEDPKSKDAEREPSEEPAVIQENLRPDPRNLELLVDDSIRGTERTDAEEAFEKLKATLTTEDPEEFWDGQPCCCSRRESIPHRYRILRQSATDGMMVPTKTKQISSSLYMRPVISSSVTYSHSTSELNTIPILDAPTDSTSERASPDCAMQFPTFGSFGSASPPSRIEPQISSSPVLRLMGKNLMVMNKEERLVQQQNQTAPCSSGNTSNGKYMSLLGFSSTCTLPNLDGIQDQPHQALEGCMLAGQHPLNIQAPVPLPAERISSFAGTLFQSVEVMKTNSSARHRMLDKKTNSSAVYNSAKVCTPYERQTPGLVNQPPVPETEIIVIDDSPEHENEPSGSLHNPASAMVPPFPGSDIRQVRSFSCYPSQNLLQPRDLGCGIKPGFPISYPMHDRNFSPHESSGPLLPRYFMVPSHSAGQVAATLYHSPSIQ